MTKPTATRSRTITWEDPVAAAEQRLDLSGLDHLNAIREGRVPPPPIAVLMGLELVEAGEGRAVFAVTPEEFHYNPIGVVHGGLAATLIDSATGCAVQSTLEPGVLYTSLEVKVNFARAITRDTGRARVRGHGRPPRPHDRDRRGAPRRRGERQAARARDRDLPAHGRERPRRVDASRARLRRPRPRR